MTEPASPEEPRTADEVIPAPSPPTVLVIGGPNAGTWLTLNPTDWDYDADTPAIEFKLLSAPRQIVLPGASPNGHGQPRVLPAHGTAALVRYEFICFGATRLHDGANVSRWCLRHPEPPTGSGDPGVQLSEALVKLFFDGSVTPPC